MILPRPQVTTVLTDTEQKVVEYLKKGYSNAAIAAELGNKEKTVKFHLTNIYRKMGVSGDRELLAKVYAAGFSFEQISA